MHGCGGSTILSSAIKSSSAFDGSKSSCFEFQPTSGSNSVASLSIAGSLASADKNNQQSDQGMQVKAQSSQHTFSSSEAPKGEVVASSNELSLSDSVQEIAAVNTAPVQTDSDKSNQRILPTNEVQALHTDQSGIASAMCERTFEDGYNWCKYGQKLVKGSEYPRSYYKCTHPNCEVKKLFERAPDGQIIEIIYKGTHDHPKPQPNLRLSAGSMISIREEESEKSSFLEGKPSTISGQIAQDEDPTITAELYPSIANENTVEVGLSQLNRSPDAAAVDDDPLAKRRKMEISGVDINSVIKPIREPRVVVQTLSKVDILDDGYRWRKYGQKVVRGNPNPRSYYRCTSAGCPVRKHVERASHDSKAVITTYEGKHNHDVPAGKNSNHDTTASVASRARPQDSKTVSLDLGVGISSAADSAPDKHQPMDTEPSVGQAQISTSNLLLLHAAPISTFRGYINVAMMPYGSTENRGEGINVRNPSLSHTTHPYPQNIGRLLMGP